MRLPTAPSKDGSFDRVGRRNGSCVYTALLNGYEKLNEQPVAHSSSIDFICFTDDPSLTSETWEIRVVEPLFPGDAARSQRALKICAHRVIPQYDASLYIDNSVLLTQPPEAVFDALLADRCDLAVLQHSYRETVRDEFDEVVALGLDAAFTCKEQQEHYAALDPASLDLTPLWSGILVRRHNDPSVITAMERWFAHVLRYSRRDQLSVWYALRAESVHPSIHVLDNHESPFHRWPIAVGRDRSRGGTVRVLDYERRLLQFEDNIAQLEAENARLLGTLHAVYSTRSWRWTSPLRWGHDSYRLACTTALDWSHWLHRALARHR
jgi:hypothetical protein